MGLSSSGSFHSTISFLEKLKSGKVYTVLHRGGQRGVQALQAATPKDTSRTARSWRYEIENNKGFYTIHWVNDDIEGGSNVAVLIQYGHGTGTGGYVQGRDYINPAMRPIFDQIAEDVWKEVTNA